MSDDGGSRALGGVVVGRLQRGWLTGKLVKLLEFKRKDTVALHARAWIETQHETP